MSARDASACACYLLLQVDVTVIDATVTVIAVTAGAGAHSYLPDGLNLEEHIGVGISSDELAANTAFTKPGIVQVYIYIY
jgi:hypothetical protein